MDRLFEFLINHWELSSAFAVLLVLLFLTDRKKSGTLLSPQQLTMMLNKDEGVVVDIREQKEFSEGRIKGAIHIPFNSLKDRMTELEKYKDKHIILVDKMGQHSGMAGKTLRAGGFSQIARLSGGITEWKNATLPLVKK